LRQENLRIILPKFYQNVLIIDYSLQKCLVSKDLRSAGILGLYVASNLWINMHYYQSWQDWILYLFSWYMKLQGIEIQHDWISSACIRSAWIDNRQELTQAILVTVSTGQNKSKVVTVVDLLKIYQKVIKSVKTIQNKLHFFQYYFIQINTSFDNLWVLKIDIYHCDYLVLTDFRSILTFVQSCNRPN